MGSTRPIQFNENPVDSSAQLEGGSENGGENKSGFKQSRPMNLMVARSPLFTVPPGLSPSGLLNSPGFFSPPVSLQRSPNAIFNTGCALFFWYLCVFD